MKDEATLLDLMIEYLEEHGWYFDWDHACFVWEKDSKEELLKSWPDAIRRLHAWTVPQWGNYWSSPKEGEELPPWRKRRYEDLKDAVWSQMLREQEPENYEIFFQVGA